MTLPTTETAPTESKQTNRLAREKSPYLLQHAHNPVDWFPWGEEAFAKARSENKPIFLSIGYSTCHWCHVMAHESFENAEIAAIMNREFVNIKVDREERPDVDRVYMIFVQASTGSGGWPMSVWLAPDLKPFVGGTYFPPEDRHGQAAFPKILEQVAAAWKRHQGQIVEQGTKIIAALEQAQSVSDGESAAVGVSAFDAAYQQFAQNYDAHEGGFSLAPKFPRPATLNFLFRYYQRHRKSESGQRALEMNLFTLRKMAAGGMHDHLGGGFHRYSVDAFWHVPHFEKMLYDQAQLAIAFLDAFQITRDVNLGKVARGVLDYVQRDMTAKEGGFFSAEDADSPTDAGDGPHGGTREGAFYVWTKNDLDAALGSDAEVFNYLYGVHVDGNVPPGADPHGELTGKNVLIQLQSVAEAARHFKMEEKEVLEVLVRSRQVLFLARAKRPRPHLDDKIITAWNGLMISAFARGAQILGDPAYQQAALRAAIFIRKQLYDDSKKVLVRSYREGRSVVEGFADDYAFVIQGLLDLYEACFDVNLLQFAIELQETQDRLFFDVERGGYFSGSGQDRSILLRMKEETDSAEPAASSVAALNLLRLAQFRDEKSWRERAERTINAFSVQIGRFPSALPQMLVALDFRLGKPRQIVVAGEGDAKETPSLLAEINGHFMPNKVVMLANNRSRKFLEEKSEAVRGMQLVDGRPAVYLCENFTCKAPVNTPEALRELLTTNEHE